MEFEIMQQMARKTMTLYVKALVSPQWAYQILDILQGVEKRRFYCENFVI